MLGVETADGANDVVIVEGTAALARDDDPAVVAASPVFTAKYAAGLTDGVGQWRRQFPQAIVVAASRVVAWSKPAGALRFTEARPGQPG